MKRRLAWPLAIAFSGFTIASADADEGLPTAALNEEARAQYKLGSEALAERHYAEAALHFETAASRTPHAVSWFMASKAWEQASKPERAADDLARALDMPGLDAPLAEQIKTRLKRVESLVGTVVVTGPAGTRVSIDDGTATPVPARLHGLPGRHVIHVTPSAHAAYQRELLLASATETPLAVTESDDEKGTPEPTLKVVEKVVEVERPAEVRRYVGFGVIGLGVASLAGAAVLGFTTNDARDAYKTSRTQDEYDHVRTLQSATNIMLVTGAVLAAGGVALVLWPSPKSNVTVGAGFGNVVVGGRF